MPTKTLTLTVPYYSILGHDSFALAILHASKHLTPFQRLILVGFCAKFEKRGGPFAIDNTYEMKLDTKNRFATKALCTIKTLDI